MANEATERNQADEVQIFDVLDVLERRDHLPGRVDKATSPNSFVAVFKTPPRGGEPSVHHHPDSDQILFVLKGDMSVQGLSGKFTVKPNHGVLIPAGVHYGFTNETQEDLVFLSMRTESTGGRRVAYVKNEPSNVHVKIPAEEIGGKGIKRSLYVYALNRCTIGISPVLMEEWNKGSLLRMNCDFEESGSHIIANLPKRLVQWYMIDSLSESDYELIPEADKNRVRLDLRPLISRLAVRP